MELGGGITIANGAGFTGSIAIGAGSLVRTGVINIGTGGSGNITIGSSTCNTNAYNVYVDGSGYRMPRLIFKGNIVIADMSSGNSTRTLGTVSVPSGLNAFELICMAWNSDQAAQAGLTVVAAIKSDGTLTAMCLNSAAGAARISYAVYAP